jgi:hypothetical protein
MVRILDGLTIHVSDIRRPWLRRLAILGSAPVLLVYSFVAVPILIILEALMNLLVIPLVFASTIVRSAWRTW